MRGTANRWDVAAPALLGLGVTVLLLVLGNRYGPHRDEFYYLASGLRPAFGYVDNPPLVPLIARAEFAVLGDSALALRVVPAILAGLTVVVTAMIARELADIQGLDRTRGAATLAAACMAVAAFPLGTGHMLSTSTVDLLAWATISWLAVRGLRHGGPAWLAVGAVAGLALENKTLVAGLLGALVVGVLVVGPRDVFADRWLWAGAILALALWAPNLVWQATHGWPQLGLGQQIATEGNGGSAPRWAFPLFQLVDVSPFLVPVWVAGLWALARDPELARTRAMAVAYALLFVALIALGGKHYYLVGMYPVLLAAGAPPTLRWVRRGRARVRAGLLTAAIVVSAVASLVLVLPVVPARDLAGTPIPQVQPISGDTIGWPEMLATVASVDRALPADQRASTVVLGQNYGEAGAVETARRHPPYEDLPVAYSGHNSYADWGPPSESATTAIVIGYGAPTLGRWFGSVRPAARLDNGVGLDTLEQGRTVWVATDRRVPWTEIWPQLRRIG